MPSRTILQAATMRAACKDPAFAKKVGIPQDVACDFMHEDQRVKKEKEEKDAPPGKKSTAV